jgi:uncharacterized protein (DUF2252 family)
MKVRSKTAGFEPTDRASVLDERRKLKMARSVHAYVRGNTLKFYEWLETTTGDSIPDGPPVWICGDCHVGNLGPLANAKGRVEIAIRDLDQTVIGNPAHDLIRLGLSLATAARGSNLSGVTTAVMLEQMMEGYGQALSNPSAEYEDFGRVTKPVQLILNRALHRRWRHLAEERIENVKPSIPLGKRFWALSDEERGEIARLFQTEEVHSLITGLRYRGAEDEIKVLDTAYWVKGCSSLGRLRYALILRVGKRRGGELCLVDIKEAVEAAAPRSPGVTMPEDNAVRIVEGARKLSPFLGERMLATELLGHKVVVRELLPQDLKLELTVLTQEEATSAAHLLAMVVGKAHGRQMDTDTRQKWQSTLNRNRLKSLDAPSWLWESVVQLVATHESAYLEHCRQYAMQKAAA